jgi:hypothetical protein
VHRLGQLDDKERECAMPPITHTHRKPGTYHEREGVAPILAEIDDQLVVEQTVMFAARQLEDLFEQELCAVRA